MSTDDKIVSVTFDARKFETGINKTVSNVNKLNSSLKFPNAGKGFEDINKAAQQVDLSKIASGVDTISSKLNAVRIAAIAVFSNMAIQASQAAIRIAKSFSIGPIQQGLQIYQTKLQAIQTILANTQAAGTGIKEVNKTLQDLNKYSNLTIYRFADMTKNIGTFTAAGVDLKTSAESIKGIANLAALSGSSTDQAAIAMYQLSQAIAAGQVHLQDWNSVVNAGMGGAVFQRALAQTAEAMGTIRKGTLKLVGPMKNVSIAGESFRQSLQTKGGGPSWLTSKVLTTTLAGFTGDLTKAQLKAEGFNAEQIKAIQATAKTAVAAATQVKTFSQLLDVSKETFASGWARSIEIVVGNLDEAKKVFTGISNVVGNFATVNANARNKVLQTWKNLGGRTLLLTAFKQAFRDIFSVVNQFRLAFRDLFPKKTGAELFTMTQRFLGLTEALKPSPKTLDNLRHTFHGLFAILDIGFQIVSGIVTVFKELFKAAGAGDGGFLKFTASIGDFLVSIDEALKKGNAFHEFFVKMGAILGAPIKLLSRLAGAVAGLFHGFSPGGVSKGMNEVTKAMTPLQWVLHSIVILWDKFISAVKGTVQFLIPDIDKIADAFQQLGPAISNALAHMNYEAILQTIRTGLFAALIIMMRNFFGSGGLFRLQSKVTIFSLMFKNVGNGIDALTGTLRSMQTNLKAQAIERIAISVALLAASVVALSLADPKRVNSALASMALLFAGLIYTLKVLDSTSTQFGAAKIGILTASLDLLAISIGLLTLSVIALSRLSWDQLKKGLIGFSVILIEITAVSQKLGESAPGMIRAGIGISAIGVGLNIMALAIRQLGSLSLKEIAKGLLAIDVSLGIIVATMSNIKTKAILRVSVSLNAIAISLNLLALAVKQFGQMDLKTIAQGLVGIGASLRIIIKAMTLMPEKNLLRIGASLLLVSIALQGIAFAVQNMGQMSMKEIAHGLVALAGALLLTGDALNAMQSNIRGAAALAVMAAGLALLVPSLVLLGNQSWPKIIKGLVGLAGAMAILVVASKLLDAVSLSLLGFGAALFLIGGAIALAGAGVAAFGVGLGAVAVSGAAAATVMTKAIEDFATSIPILAKEIVLGALEIVKAFSETAPQFVDAMVKIINSLLDVIIKSTPKLVKAIEVVLTAILKIINDKQEDVIQTGLSLILAFLKGLKQNIKQITEAAGDVVISFLQGLGTKATDIVTSGINIIIQVVKGILKGALRLVNAGAKAIVKFLNGIADAIDKYEPQIIKAGFRIGIAIITGMIRGLAGGTKLLLNKIKELADKMIDKLHLGWLIKSPSLVAETVGKNITKGLANGITKTQHDPVNAIDEMNKNMATALANGIAKNEKIPVEAMKYMSKNMIIAAKGTFGITASGTSATMQQLGKDVATSFANGLRGSSSDIKQAFTDLNSQLFDAASSARDTINSENENIKQQQGQIKQDVDNVNQNLSKLRSLAKDPKKNAKEIAAANKEIANSNKSIHESSKAILKSQNTIKQNQTVIDNATKAHLLLTGAFKEEKAELIDLSKGYDSVSAKLDKANQALADAKQLRKDAFTEYKNQYNQLPDLSNVDPEASSIATVTAYERALQKQIDAVKAYHKTLDGLRKLGLDDTTYKKLLADGTIDQKFADSLLAGGKSAVQDVNKLDKQLLGESTSLAQNAASNLYDAGVAAAQGLVDGLRSKKSELASSIAFLAKLMVHDIKAALGIKSPSTVFADIGKYAAQGIAKGLIDSSKAVTDAVYMVSDDAMGAMNNSLSNISSMISDNIDPNPTITPILDLSEVQKSAQSLGSIFDKTPITAKASISSAALIAGRTTQPVSDVAPAASGETLSPTFVQNNFSPEALSDVDIYRNTKTLFAQHTRRLRGV